MPLSSLARVEKLIAFYERNVSCAIAQRRFKHFALRKAGGAQEQHKLVQQLKGTQMRQGAGYNR